jgi:hypothetical protein
MDRRIERRVAKRQSSQIRLRVDTRIVPRDISHAQVDPHIAVPFKQGRESSLAGPRIKQKRMLRQS